MRAAAVPYVPGRPQVMGAVVPPMQLAMLLGAISWVAGSGALEADNLLANQAAFQRLVEAEAQDRELAAGRSMPGPHSPGTVLTLRVGNWHRVAEAGLAVVVFFDEEAESVREMGRAVARALAERGSTAVLVGEYAAGGGRGALPVALGVTGYPTVMLFGGGHVVGQLLPAELTTDRSARLP